MVIISCVIKCVVFYGAVLMDGQSEWLLWSRDLEIRADSRLFISMKQHEINKYNITPKQSLHHTLLRTTP